MEARPKWAGAACKNREDNCPSDRAGSGGLAGGQQPGRLDGNVGGSSRLDGGQGLGRTGHDLIEARAAAQLSQAPPQVVLLGGGCRKQVAQTLLQRDPAALGPGAQDLDHALLQLANQDLSHVDCSAISYAIKLGLFVRRTLQAFANGLLQDGQLWIDMLEQRNLMAHAYDVKRARQALALIQDRFAPALLDLAADLERQR